MLGSHSRRRAIDLTSNRLSPVRTGVVRVRWSARKVFKAFEIPSRSGDLDSAACHKDNWGGQIRNAFKARTKSPTIPQIFVANQRRDDITRVALT